MDILLSRPNQDVSRMAVRALIIISSALLSACSTLSGSSLRCGVDGDSSYVELVKLPQTPVDTRYYAGLCGFLFDQDNDLVRRSEINEGGHFDAPTP